MISRKIAHHLILDRHQVAADRPIVRPEINTLRGSFERRPSGKVLIHVIAQQTHVGDSRAGREMVGDIVCPTNDTCRGDHIHVGRLGRLQRSLAAKRFLRLVGTTVGNDDGVFH